MPIPCSTLPARTPRRIATLMRAKVNAPQAASPSVSLSHILGPRDGRGNRMIAGLQWNRVYGLWRRPLRAEANETDAGRAFSNTATRSARGACAIVFRPRAWAGRVAPEQE